jgi:spectrin beta
LDLDEQYLGLKTLVTVRLNKLNEANKLYQYLKEVDELADWINEQIQVVSSEEYGHDFEHLQVLHNM